MPLSIELVVSPYLNLPLRDNQVPAVRSLTLTNTGVAPTGPLQVRLSADPPGVLPQPLLWNDVRLEVGQSLKLPLDELRLDYEYFSQLSEGLTGRFTAVATEAEAIEHGQTSADTRLLPSNHWGGMLAAPELLAAHVLPNDPAVAAVLRRSSELLHSSDSALSLNGYQSNSPQEAGAQAIAILTAVRELGLHYALPPKSFERSGQKVRTPSQMVAEGLGTCLDLTCFAAAALEQAGLHAVIVLVEGHCYLASWLQPSPHTHGVLTDAQELRKTASHNLLLGCETTLLVDKGDSASESVNASLVSGKKQLLEGANFQVAVDMHAARSGERVRPLGQKLEVHALADSDNGDAVAGLDLSMLAGTAETLNSSTQNAAKPVLSGTARVDAWKSKLLDLTRRNKLLNWRPTSGSIELHYVDAAALEDRLADGAKLRFDAVDTERSSHGVLGRKLGADHYEPAIAAALQQGQLLVTDTPATLQKALLKMERGSRLALEEGGASTLFIALGFAIKRSPKAGPDERPEYRAPLILLPVELRRRRAGNSFQLVQRDEDALLNPTLLEFLRREVGVTFEGLTDELPTDDSGLDVPGIFHQIRDHLLNVPGWEVSTDVALGEFSFSKYLMWRDLDRFTQHLADNPVVAHLINSPRQPYHVPGGAGARPFPVRDTLDETFPITEMLTPMSADSSQLAAVRAAAQGIDFVLEGPPGTGKSQTITNLIAQCLGEGKTVLFVSEKTAALDVVERRLNSIGLGDFCLELHSAKATKTAVYDQLRAAKDASAPDSTDWRNRAEQLGSRRRQLNDQIDALHLPRAGGLSVYDAVSFAAQHPEVSSPDPPRAWVQQLTSETLLACRELTRQLALRLANIDVAAHSALTHVTQPIRDESAFAETCQGVIDAAQELDAATSRFAKATGALLPTRDKAHLLQLDQLAQVLQGAHGQDYADAAQAIDSGRVRKELANEIQQTILIATAFAALSGSYRPEVLDVDAPTQASDWQEAEQKWVLFRIIQQWMLARKLNGFAEPGHKPADVGADYDQLREITEARGKLKADEARNLPLTKTAIQQAGVRAKWLESYAKLGDAGVGEALGFDYKAASTALEHLAEEDAAATELVAAAKAYSQSFAQAQTAAADLASAMSSAVAEELNRLAEAPVYYAALAEQANALLAHRREWRLWGQYATVRKDARGAGMSWFEPHPTEPTKAMLGFELGVRRVLAKAALADDDRLRSFSGSVFEDLISTFARLDAELSAATSAELQMRLKAGRSNMFRKELREEIGVLNHQLAKKRGQLPVRQLVKKLGPLLPELTPCLLMSPLSIAQYLPADRATRFDVVVFDEASQIPVWDAVGAIARGKQVVVVGDSKQLPPTSFFSRSDDGDDLDEDVVEDMESILDEMKAASLQTWRLRWHYRSRAESLIAFSNRTYYNGELHTFPAPLTNDDAVQFHKVESLGYRSGLNRPEAEALVAYLVARMEVEPPTDKTFGVVTFGQKQQTLIEDLLEVARTEHPGIEAHFDPELDERVFVKNIENVQGDERDVILFSITYGPDESGKLAMRFGPMNQTGGERRLNVAVTRARREMHLFSSIEPEQIDPRRLGDSAQGARDLRTFLEFAKKGSRAFAEQVERVGQAGDYDSPFEQVVAEALRARGWETDPQVGVSGYRIDLGVRDPRHEGRYLAGVECDGASYHSTATARERDILRQAVLEGLGWNIVRIWSLDWWHDAERVADKVAAELKVLVDAPQKKQPQLKSQPVKQQPEEQLEPAPEFANQATAQPSTSAVPSTAVAAPPNLSGPLYQYATAQDLKGSLYRATRLAQCAAEEALYDHRSLPATVEMVQQILSLEAPILYDELVKRVSSEGYGFGRIGAKIKKAIHPAIKKAGHLQVGEGETVVWKDDAQSIQPLTFRMPNPVDTKPRGIKDIPLVELCALAKELIPLGLDNDELIREMGSRIGVARVSGSSRKRVERAVELAWS